MAIFFAATAHARPPSIVLIVADDLGYADLGCYGQSQIKTPNLDRFSQESMRFTQVYSGASVCAPSRCVLMTGLHTGHARVRGNGAMQGGILVEEYGKARRVGLSRDDTTLATYLRSAGYATGLAGKWGLGEAGTEGEPTKQGFDESFGYLNQDHASIYYTDHLWKNGQRFPIPENSKGQQQVYSHDRITDFALDFIERLSAQPFFLYLTWTLPHQEYVIPDLGEYASKDWSHNAKVHAAMVTLLDRDFGRVRQKLHDLGLDDSTLLMFTSDNGAETRWDGLFDAAGPFRGQKGSQWEGGLRVPMLVRLPVAPKRGSVNDTVWSFVDIMPTLCELANVEPRGNVDGISILPTLQGQSQSALRNRSLYWEQYSKGGYWQSIRWGDWKGHAFLKGDRFELYNLAQDPTESKDLAAEYPEIVAKIRSMMKQSYQPSEHWIPKS